MRTFHEYCASRSDALAGDMRACFESLGIKDVLKGAAVGGAFMVPVAGIPLAVYLARRLYGEKASPEQIRALWERLKGRLQRRRGME